MKTQSNQSTPPRKATINAGHHICPTCKISFPVNQYQTRKVYCSGPCGKAANKNTTNESARD